MPKLTVIVGMAGSGKSCLCNEIATRSTPATPAFKDGTLTNTNERRAGHECLGEIIARLLGCGEDCVMDEAHLTDPSFRASFIRFCETFLPKIELEWRFFEADVVACINNVYRDAQNGRRQLCRYKALDAQRKLYSVPDEAALPGRTVHSVYQCESPRFSPSEESDAIQWLQSEIAQLSDSTGCCKG